MLSEEVAWDFIQSDLENFKGWKLYNLPGNLLHCWTVLMGKNVSPYIQFKPILFHHKHVVSHPDIPHTPLPQLWRSWLFSVLCMGAGAAVWFPHIHLISRLNKPCSLSLTTGRVLQQLTSLIALMNLLQFVNSSLVLESKNGLLYLDVV